MSNEKISIVVPVYNVEKYVSKCIESIINQTYSNLEIILINDGSTDISGCICDYYAKKDNRIIVVHQNNQGLSMARNNGINISTGDYIGFVDSDDWIEIDMFEVLFKNIVNFDANISICDYSSVYENGKNDRKDLSQIQSIITLKGKDILHYFLLNYHGHTLIHETVWNKLYKRFLFDKIRFPPNRIYEDIFTTYLLVDAAQNIVISSTQKYNYLRRKDSITGQSQTTKIFDIVEGNLQRYEYIKLAHFEFEQVCRKILLNELIAVLYKISREKFFETSKEYVNRMVDIVKNIDIYSCGLEEYSVRLLELFMQNDRKWIVAIKLYGNSLKI